MSGHLYDWLRARGYWQQQGWSTAAQDAPPPPPTHLLLDGGKARVPDESHGAFLNAYASSLARHPGRRPCVVELRTPVFKMFLDLDTRFCGLAQAEAARQGEESVRDLLARLSALVSPGGTALVCVADRVKKEGEESWKLGFHVVWPDVLVTAPTALELRRRMLEHLGAELPAASLGLCSAWDSVLDASVYTSNGLRMPWSAKGRGDTRFYELRWVLTGEGRLQGAAPSSVSAVRECLHQLSIRTFSKDPTLRLAPDADPADADDSARVVPKCLAAYSDVLTPLAASLPVEFLGQKFTGLMATEHCFMLRSTARFCFNLGRAHRTNNVYFVLTRRGVTQRCYCRCETAEGRKYGMCKDFVSDCWQVPKQVLDSFFPPGDAPPPTTTSSTGTSTGSGSGGGSVAPMPSRTAKSFLNFESLMARSRPVLSPQGAKRRKKQATQTKKGTD